MNTPHDQSVTSVPCECGWLRRQARDSHGPVVFDEVSGAYKYKHEYRDRNAQYMIYHCPWCGGVAGSSHQGSAYVELNEDACNVVSKRIASCSSLEEAIQVLGPPDEDDFTQINHYETEIAPARIDRIRQIVYHDLADNMSVYLEQQIGGGIGQMFVPKPLKNHS